MRIFRPPLRLIASLVVTTGALLLASALPAGASSAPTAKSVVAALTKALAKETSVHVEVDSTAGKATSKLVADIGQTTGRETFSSGKETYSISVTPKYAYLSGSKSGLIKLMGMSTAQQARLGSKTLAIKKGTAQYATFKNNLITTAFGYLVPSKGVSIVLKPQRDKATNGFDLGWSEPATSTTPEAVVVMTVSSTKTVLPIRELISTSEGSSKTTFTRWGKNFRIPIPKSTIPYSSFIKAAN
jgi:hypothetical protein